MNNLFPREGDAERFEEFVGEYGDKEGLDNYLRWKCLSDLYFLGSEILGFGKAKRNGKPLLDPVFHQWLADRLNEDTDTLIEVPRGHLKSTWLKAKIIQNFLRNPNQRQGLFSSTTTLVRKEMVTIKRWLCTPMLLRLFPDQIPAPGKDYKNWFKVTQDELTIKWDEEIGEPPEGNQISVYGAGSAITGTHNDIHYYDDLVSPEWVTTEEQITKLRDWYSYAQGVLEPGGTEFMIGTPYHYHDLYNTVETEEMYPPDRVFKRPVKEGGQFIYSWFTEEYLEKKKRRMTPYAFSCQYWINPIPREDQLFPPPQPTYRQLPEEPLRWYFMLDPAPTSKSYSDDNAIVVAAVSERGMIYYHEAAKYRKRGEEIARILIRKTLQYHPTSIGIESHLFDYLQYIIQTETSKWQESTKTVLSLPIEPIPVSNKQDKVTRINWTLGSAIRSGQARIHESCTDLMLQMENLTPNYEGKDDIVDAASMLFLLVPNFAFLPEGPPREKWKPRDTFSILDLFGKKKSTVGWNDRFPK